VKPILKITTVNKESRLYRQGNYVSFSWSDHTWVASHVDWDRSRCWSRLFFKIAKTTELPWGWWIK
jgi:hypothetical protein